jgi:hypothetical protein
MRREKMVADNGERVPAANQAVLGLVRAEDAT